MISAFARGRHARSAARSRKPLSSRLDLAETSPAMELRVAAYRYQIVIAGTQTMAEFHTRTITISEVTPPGRRLEELTHEAWHCWLFHVPPPQDEEQEAQLVALVLGSLRADLARQGGEAALMALQPFRPVLAASTPTAAAVLVSQPIRHCAEWSPLAYAEPL